MRRRLLWFAGPVVALLAAGLSAGCRSAPMDFDRAVRVQLSNPTPMRVWVAFSRSAGGAHWVRSVGPERDEEHLVRHRAFGDGPVRVFLIRWPGSLHLRKVYGHRDEIRVPPGSEIVVRLDRDLRHTTVWMVPDRSEPRPAEARRPPSDPSVERRRHPDGRP